MDIKKMTTTALLERKQELELILKPEETTDYFRVPVPKEEGKHDGHRIRTIDLDADKGIKALYCGECKVIITYLFAKDKGWTMESAQAWVREHGKSMAVLNELEKETKGAIPHKERGISQAEIKDELDYLAASVKAEGLNAEAKEIAWGLVREIMGIRGSQIPLDIAEKVGTVLHKKNLERLGQIQALAQEVIDSAQHEEEPEKAGDPELTMDEIKQIVKTQVSVAFRKAQGKID